MSITVLPTLVSFTGADEKTDTSEMVKISREYPQVEWGILIHPEKIHTLRNPGWAWVDRLAHMGMTTAAHLCGKEIFLDLLNPALRGNVIYHLKWFKNIQVNINARSEIFTPEQVMDVYDIVMKCNRNLILQYNEGSKKTIKTWIEKRQPDLSKIIILYDSSKGVGIVPDVWPEPVEEYELKMQRRFAGGIKPENVIDQIAAINNVSMVGETGYAIDLESGARNVDNEFDIGIVRKMLSMIYPTASGQHEAS